MFDFLESDLAIFLLNIFFLIFIYFDYKKYKQSGQKLYVLNILLTIGFAVWILWPLYTKYITWSEKERLELFKSCHSVSDKTLCECINEHTVKNYSYAQYRLLDKKSAPFQSFLKETKEECLED